MQTERPTTLGGLRDSGYQVLPIREEMRQNLIRKMRQGDELFPGILGYEETVIPQLENAILSGQDLMLLGERGQAKTRIIRRLTNLLDEWTPILAESEIPENPFAPITAQAKAWIAEKGDQTPILWMPREERYGEKLATPDITIADLIGEVDPIKVAEGRYLSDELTLHYGLIPKTNRGIFAINELPDLAERIQVGLFNVMEERDIQIRGHKVRMNLDILIVATANPEDYTNRGRIITPLKDRYGSQIRTHYPLSVEREIEIMENERDGYVLEGFATNIPLYMKEIVAEISHQARRSPDINQRSGVSVRASIYNFETLLANALRRAIRLQENEIVPRISDLPFLMPSLQAKVELEIIDDDKEEQVMQRLFEDAITTVFEQYFTLEELETVILAFRDHLSVETGEGLHAGFYEDIINQVEGLDVAIEKIAPDDHASLRAAAVEFILEGLHLQDKLNKDHMQGQIIYRG